MAAAQTVIVAGIGCGRGVSPAEILALIEAALVQFGIPRQNLSALATEAAKAGEPALLATAQALSLPLLRCSLAELDDVKSRLITRSSRVQALKGVTSIAEAAALVGAGADARLRGPRLTAGRVTCAIAESETP